MKFLLISSLLLITSCAQIGYLSEQGISQLKLQWSGKENKKLLSDPNIDSEMKRKINLVESYKDFFYDYFNKDKTSIYTKTSILKQEAVTYLLIASPPRKIKAHKFSFPFFGEFPYLGFFNKESAKSYAKDLENDGLVTWIRPVYAYSTLGYLEDRILSSFFYYDDLELAELIFHELYHTIFFVKDDVDLNENMANYFGKELVKIYFKDDPRLMNFNRGLESEKIISSTIITLIKELEVKLSRKKMSINEANEVVAQFTNNRFLPQMKLTCSKLNLMDKSCIGDGQWNQARFAAFLTYEEEQDLISDLQSQLNLGVKDFYQWIKVEYKEFKKIKEDSFTDYLRGKLNS